MTGRRAFNKDNLFQLKVLQSGRLSPDGRKVIYGLSHVTPELKEFTALWLLDVASGQARPLTSGTARDSAPAWSPDGKQIAFVSTRGGAPQIYIIPIDGGEARPLTAMKQGIGSGPVWSPDGRHIAFTAGPAFDTPPDPSRPYRVTRAVYRYDGVGNLDWGVQDIYVIAADGGEPRRLTCDDSMNVSPHWSPDSKAILFGSALTPNVQEELFTDLKVVSLIDGGIRTIVSGWGQLTTAAWMPDGGRLIVMGQPDQQDTGSKDDLWIVRCNGQGAPECRTAALDYHLNGMVDSDMAIYPLLPEIILLAPDGKTAYARVQQGRATHIYRIALEGGESCEPIVSGGTVHYLQDMQQGKLLYAASSINEPPDLYIANLDGSGERRLTHLNEQFLAGIDLPELEYLEFTSEDGTPVKGGILKPVGRPAPYPTILYIHGGPHAAYGNVFRFDFQLLAGAGYAVLFVNNRASTGYGNRFATVVKGDFGNLDYKDLMAGVDHAIARGLADPERLGVAGASGGGNLTCWVIGQTNRFKAAVPGVPVTDFLSFYGTSDVGVSFCVHKLGGHPWEIPEVYHRCSPINYAHNCTTPTLMVQCEHDWRCPNGQSEQFYSVLKASGCDVEMLRLPDSPHGGFVANPVMRRAHNEAMLDWFDHYLLGQARRSGIV